MKKTGILSLFLSPFLFADAQFGLSPQAKSSINKLIQKDYNNMLVKLHITTPLWAFALKNDRRYPSGYLLILQHCISKK